MTRFGERVEKWLEPPDPSLLEAGAGGEMLVANTRLVFWVFIGLAPLSAAIAGGRQTPPEVWIALTTVSMAVVVSAWVVRILRRGSRVPMIGLVTGAGDVSVVTLTIAAVALAGQPVVAIESKVTWAVYLLGILATSLRFDIRICLFVGFLSIVEYSALLLWATARWDLPIVSYAPEEVQSVNMLLQIVRLMLMMAATAMSIGIVYRCRELVFSSGRDRLTGLGNRRYFEERLAVELARLARSGNAMTLVLFDLDRFKQFNDRWGHAHGDDALRRVARILDEESRKEDILARWGGEEIALVLPDTGIDGALRKIERIRTRLATDELIVKGEVATLTVSCGVALYPADGTDEKSLFAAADRRLMLAKRAGRDRVVTGDGRIVSERREM